MSKMPFPSIEKSLTKQALPCGWGCCGSCGKRLASQCDLCASARSLFEQQPHHPACPTLRESFLPSRHSLTLCAATSTRISCRPSVADKIGFVRQGEGGGYEMMVPFVYDEAFDFVEGLAAVRQNGKWGFVDEKASRLLLLSLI